MNSIFTMYKRCFFEANQDFIRNWRIIVALVPIPFLYAFIMPLLAPLGIIGQFLSAVANLALLTMYYYWIESSFNRKPLNINEILYFNKELFFSVLSTAFVLFLVNLILSTFAHISEDSFLLLAVNLIVFIIFNPIAEVTYNDLPQGYAAFPKSFEFIRSYWIEWFIPVAVIFLPLILVPKEIALILSTASPLFPASIVFTSLTNIHPLAVILALPLAHWYMLFRGRLYNALWGR